MVMVLNRLVSAFIVCLINMSRIGRVGCAKMEFGQLILSKELGLFKKKNTNKSKKNQENWSFPNCKRRIIKPIMIPSHFPSQIMIYIDVIGTRSDWS